jgi:hypothetical protein
MKKSTLCIVALAFALTLGSFPLGTIFKGMSLVTKAEAVVGRPRTPVSVAGVARRTTRRVIRRTTIYVASLPPKCTVVVIEGTTLQQCGGTYYQPSGTQYVVVHVD